MRALGFGPWAEGFLLEFPASGLLLRVQGFYSIFTIGLENPPQPLSLHRPPSPQPAPPSAQEIVERGSVGTTALLTVGLVRWRYHRLFRV